VGELYPVGSKPSEFLSLYSRAFRSVELNSSFYHPPTPHQVQQWKEQTPTGFRFCPKVYRGITENLASVDLPPLVESFCAAISHFEDRLGLCFAQFPETFTPKHKPLLERFLEVWPPSLSLSVELRHPTWFAHHALLDDVVNLFYRRKVASVITDTVGKKEVLHLSLTQPKVLIRFQGNNGHPWDHSRLLEWKNRLKKWQSHSLEEIYFFTHQPQEAKIVETARLAVKEFTGVALPPPSPPPGQLAFL
jgi:uncharacterized protein YecE (DUF72 family)